jgi:PTH1 family peptidyl-tRNA hydrolase
MNKVSLAIRGPEAAAPEKPARKGQSHIRQARPKAPKVEIPEGGPMAAMLRKLLGGKE